MAKPIISRVFSVSYTHIDVYKRQDQDTLPPYEVLDTIVRMFMEENRSVGEIVKNGYNTTVVERIVRLMRINEYKRRQAPIGIRITPRGFGRDWRCPITSKYRD